MNQISFFDGQYPLKITKPIRLIELFAGIGAQAKALENLGVQFEHYRICEFDKYAVQSYNAVHCTDFQTSDITKIHAEDLNVCDTDKYTYIMTYSFPCTDLSIAGLQKGMSRNSGTRSGLLWEVERLLKEMTELPQILLMENVPEVVGSKNIADFAEWIAFLDSLGYRSKYQILNAKDYGIPQSRARCFMVSWVGDYYFNFPNPVPLNTVFQDYLEDDVDEKYFLTNQEVTWHDEHLKRHKALGHGFGWSPVPSERPDTHTDVIPKSQERLSRQGDHYTKILSRCLCIGKSLKPGWDCINRVYSQFAIAPTVTCAVDGILVDVVV